MVFATKRDLVTEKQLNVLPARAVIAVLVATVALAAAVVTVARGGDPTSAPMMAMESGMGR